MTTALNVGLGAALMIIALATQWLISKRLKHQKVSKFYSWIAWICQAVGATKAAQDIGDAMGVGSAGAVVAAIVCLLFIAVDVADRRPDWLAFILMAITPAMMRAAGGGAGEVFDLALWPLDWVGNWLGAFLGI